MSKHIKLLSTVALSMVSIGIGSAQVSADAWQANSPESIMIVEGTTSYQLKYGDTLWAIGQKLSLPIDTLAQLSGVDLASGQQYHLPVGYTIRWTADKSSYTLENSRGQVERRITVDEEGKPVSTSHQAVKESSVKLLGQIKHVSTDGGTLKVQLDKPDVSQAKPSNAKGQVPNEVVDNTSKRPTVKSLPKIGGDQPFLYQGKPLTGSSTGLGDVSLRDVIDFNGEDPFQSFALDDDNQLVYKFGKLKSDGSKSILVYDYEGNLVKTIPRHTEHHDNDVVYLNGLFYLTGGETKSKVLYTYDVKTGEETSLDVSAIRDNPNNGSKRITAGIAKDPTNPNGLLLVTYDIAYGTNDPTLVTQGDQLTVYGYDTKTNQVSEKFSDDRDFVFVQGATAQGNHLYVSTNLMTDKAENYKGIGVKVYDLENGQKVDQVTVEGNLEAEGMDSRLKADGSTEIYMGVVTNELHRSVTEFKGYDEPLTTQADTTDSGKKQSDVSNETVETGQPTTSESSDVLTGSTDDK